MAWRDTDNPGSADVYRIRVRGRLDPRWEGWFGCLSISTAPGGDTLLTGPIVDQAALHGILTRIRDLGLPLQSIYRIDPQRREDTP